MDRCQPQLASNADGLPAIRSELALSLKPGLQVVFQITEESAGEYVITHIHPVDAHAAGNQQEQ